MDTQIIIEYLQQSKKGATVPELQKSFSLSYNEVREALSTLESEGKIELCDNLHYVLRPEDADRIRHMSHAKRLEFFKREIEKEPMEFQEVLRSCTVDGGAYAERLQRNHHITPFRLRIMLLRMHEIGVLDENDNCRISAKEYVEMFGHAHENPALRGYEDMSPRRIAAERKNMAIARTRFGSLYKQKQRDGEIDEEIEDLFWDDSATWSYEVPQEEVSDKISEGERKAIGVLDVLAALLEFDKPPKNRDEAIRDVRLCLHMLRNLPPSFQDAVEHLDEAHKNLMVRKCTEFEDLRSAYFIDWK